MNTFILIVLGQIVSLFGNAALRFALPLYLLRQTGSAALYGGITALAMLPALAGILGHIPVRVFLGHDAEHCGD